MLGESYLNLGRNDLALENLLTAEGKFGEVSTDPASECFENLGLIYWNNGNLNLAQQYHEKALRIRQDLYGKESLKVGDSYNNLGLLYLGENSFKAKIYFTQAYNIYEKVLGKNHPKVAFCLINLANANNEQGSQDEALEQLQQVNERWDSIFPGEHPNKAFTLSNIGRIYAENEDWEAAYRVQSQALEMYQRLFGEKHPEVANTFLLIGNILEKQRDWEEAISNYQASVQANLFSEGDLSNFYNGDILLSSLLAKAKALESYHFDKTLKPKHLQESLRTFDQCDQVIDQLRQLRLNEKDKIRLGQISKEIYERAIRIALLLANQPFAREKYEAIAFQYCEKSKSAVLREAIAETKAKSFAGLPTDLLQLEDSLKNEITYLNRKLAEGSSSEEEAQFKNALFSLQTQYTRLIQELENDYPKYHELKYKNEVLDLKSVQRVLKEDEAAISYFEAKDRMYLFLITKEKLKVLDTEKNATYPKLIGALRNAMKYQVSSVYLETAQALYEQLIPDLPSFIARLIFIPDGISSTIPFEALVDPKTESEDFSGLAYLIKDYEISYEYSMALLVDKRTQTSSSRKEKILLFAPGNFQPETALPPLPGTLEEVESIKYLFRGNNWQTEEFTLASARESSLKGINLQEYDYLHFATHGVVHESKPELSKIFLKSGDQEDGSLFSGEIYNLQIDAQLVTLSACETGLGKLEKGEGIVGLSRALVYAGAKNLIVSLWQVADESTSKLMVKFYENYLYAEQPSFTGALRAAKLALIESGDNPHPYYWSPFVLVGY